MMAQVDFGHRVVVTRPANKAAELLSLLKERGFQALHLPLIVTSPIELETEGKNLLLALARDEFDWLYFSSAAGVAVAFDFFCVIAEGRGLGPRLKVGVQGEGTAREFRRLFGRVADFVSLEGTSEAVVAELSQGEIAGKRVLLIVAQNGRGVIESGLKEAGALDNKLMAYRTVVAEPDLEKLEQIKKLEDKNRLVFTFCSPSAVRGTFTWLERAGCSSLLKQSLLVSIGSITTKELEDRGLAVHGEASVPNMRALVEEVERVVGEG